MTSFYEGLDPYLSVLNFRHYIKMIEFKLRKWPSMQELISKETDQQKENLQNENIIFQMKRFFWQLLADGFTQRKQPTREKRKLATL